MLTKSLRRNHFVPYPLITILLERALQPARA